MNTKLVIEEYKSSSSGSHFHGQLFRTKLREKERSLGLVVKVAPADPLVREVKAIRRKFINEIHFYTKICPALRKYGDLPTIPRCLWSNDEEGKETLILEDLENFGYSLVSLDTDLGGEVLDKVLGALDKLHLASKRMSVAEPEAFKALVGPLQEAFCVGPHYRGVTIRCLENARAIAKEHLGDEYFEKVSRFDVLAELEDAVTCRENAVITHGDVWPTNIFLQYDKSGGVYDVGLIDWQMCRFASPLLDISQLIFTSCPSRHLQDTSRPSRFGFGMALIILPFALGQADPSLVLTPEKLTFPDHKEATRRVSAAIKAAVDSGVI